MSMARVSPFLRAAMGPRAAASGDTWPMQAPRVPPEKRPSVMSATLVPSPMPTMLALGGSDHAVALHHAAREEGGAGLLLRFVDAGGAAKGHHRRVDGARLDDC